jgi:hypothetical protein
MPSSWSFLSTIGFVAAALVDVDVGEAHESVAADDVHQHVQRAGLLLDLRDGSVPSILVDHSSATKSWFPTVRLYGPLQPWFDQTWKLNDLERIRRPG